MARRSMLGRLARLERQPRAYYRTIVVVDTLAPELLGASPADIEQRIANAHAAAGPQGLLVVVRGHTNEGSEQPPAEALT